MDIKVFKGIETYMDMYRCLSETKKSKDELLKFLMHQCGKSDSTARSQIQKAEDGRVAFVEYKEPFFLLDKDAFQKAITDLETELGLKRTDTVAKRKSKPEDDIPSVLSGHSPEFQQMRESVNDIGAMEKRYKAKISEQNKEIARLQKLIAEKLDDLVVSYAEKKVLVLESAKMKPPELFQKDFFRSDTTEQLPVDELVGMISPFVPEFVPEQELTTENYLKRITKILFGTELLKKKWGKQLESNKEETILENRVSGVTEERKRLESINEILRMKDIPNQVKLSLYASWFRDEDPEMRELLLFAGRNDINADYVIRILEKPRDYRNYRSMRGMLQQASEASEAHIKKEAAIELLRGDWYVEADYMGKPCKFAMMPVDEMNEFLQMLKHHSSKKAVTFLEQLIDEKRHVVTSDDGKKVEIRVKGKKGAVSKKVEEKLGLKAPDFIHENDVGIDMHPDVDEDITFDDFNEVEEKDGKQ